LYDVELWVDVMLCSGSTRETLCTIFGRVDLPMRPVAGEQLSFHQEKYSDLQFGRVLEGIGIAQENSVSMEIEEVSHYGVPGEDGRSRFHTQIRCTEIPVPSVEDARTILAILKVHGMELDPYAINRVSEGAV
jgi:hypothetical protein